MLAQYPARTSHLKQVTLAGPAGAITQWPGRKAIYQALSIAPPPRVSVFDRT
jgi:hypothetical protein